MHYLGYILASQLWWL